jgi:hypothetical protein
MPPKTLTAEQVAEIDRQQKPAVNMRNIVPQREDVLAARITAQERREAAPATLTPEQVDATEAQTSVAAMTPFGRAMGAEPDRTTGPVFQPKQRLSAAEADQMQYEQISDPAYVPTKEEFQWYEGYKKTRDDKVSRFVQGAKGMAGGLVQAAAATAYAPFDLIVRGTNAYDEWVNSSAEGLRQTSIGLAELWSWGGDIYEDNQKELQRSRDLNNQIRQQLAAENKFTGNAQQDDQILEGAINEAKAGGLYEKTADDLNADEGARYERFMRDRSFQQQAANITETNIGTLPDSQREMGIDPSKVNPGLAFTAQLVFDPLNAVVPGGIGALSNLRLMRRAAALTGTPLKGLSKVAKAGADKVEDIYGGILSGIESRTGLNEAAVMGALNNPVTWRAVAAMGILKGTGKVLRKSENWLETGSIIAKEAGVGGVGLSRADAAAKLRNAPIPGRYRRAYDGFFTSADSTLRRVSETPGLSPIARRSAATLDRTGVTQAFRLADDAVSGAAAAAPIGIPFAAIAPEDRQPEILGAILSIGAMGGVVGGQVRRMSEMNDALVAKMLADAEISGGDAVAMANMLSPEKLSDMAQKQTMISAKADWVPLRAADYELNKTVQEAVGNGTKGIHVEVTAGKRPRVFLNLDKLASGDVAGHEIGHAIFMSDIMGGEIKQGMRAMVDVEYGAEGLAARGREYAAAMLTQEVNQGATGIKLEVLTPEEVNRKAAGVSEADLIRDRWSNDSAWRESAINERIDLMDQERMARGGQQLDWARDEIAAETFSGLGKGVNLSGLRASGPLGRAVGAAQTALDMMGARFRGNGRLESPNRLFTENPLFDSPQMRKAVNDYVKIYDRYLVGLEKEGKVKQRGTPIAPTGRSNDAARSPHTRLYPNKGVVESDLFVQRPDGTLELKSQQMINTQDKARAATLKSINLRDRLVPENSQEWGARRLSNGRVVVGGPTLPPQFDFFLQMPEWLRFKAREFEAGRNEGRSYLYSYNAIGTGADGSYKVKNLGNVEAKTGEAVPFGWDLSQKNHLLAKVIDLNSFRASSMRAIDNQLLGEFGNDLKAVESGLKQLLKNYQDGVPGETNLGVTKKNILNGLLGTGTPTQRANNPAWHTLNNQGSIRTFRFDRLNYADPYGTGYFPHYDKLNINALPDNAGRMSLDEYMVFDADRQTAWLNNRARERGHSNSTNWANSDEAGFAAASEEYRKLFPRPDNNNRMPQQIPRGAQGMPDVGYGERADIPLNERARRAAFVGADGRVVSTNKRTHFETNEDLGPDFLAIGAGSISEDGFFRFGSDTMDNPMGETPSQSRAAAARHNREVYDSGRRPSELLEDPLGLERMAARGQAMPDTGNTPQPRRYVSMEKFIEEAGDDLGAVLANAYNDMDINEDRNALVGFVDTRNSMYRQRIPVKEFFDWLHSDEPMRGLVFDSENKPATAGEGASYTREGYEALLNRLRDISLRKPKLSAAARGQAMPDAAITQDGFVQAPEDAPTFKLPQRAMAQFMPDAGVNLADYADRTILALPADRMGIGSMRVGPRGSERELSVKGQGGAGFMEIYNGGGWAFSDEATGGRFMKRLREAAAPGESSVIVGITAMSEFNHLKNQTGQLAYVEALEAAIAGKSISKRQADAHIKAISQSIMQSTAKSVTDSTRRKFAAIKNLNDFAKAVRNKSLNFADAAPYSVQIARKALPIPYKEAKDIGIAFDDIGKQTADPRYADVPFGTVVALLEVPIEQAPVRSDFHYSYPFKVTGRSIGFLKKYYDVGQLTSDPRIRNSAGAVQAQPLQTVLPKLDQLPRN